MNTLALMHENVYGQSPQIVGEVPGVCTLFGSFSDLCEGYAVIGTSRDTVRIAIAVRNDDMVHLYNAVTKEAKHAVVGQIRFRKEDRWGNYLKAPLAILCSEGYRIPGMDISCAGSALKGDKHMAGVALATCMTMLVNKLCGLGMNEHAVTRVSYRSVVDFVHESCRLCDIVAMLHFESGKVLFFDLDTMRYQEIPFPFGNHTKEWFAVLLESKVSQSYMSEEVNLRRQDTKEALAELRKSPVAPEILREFPRDDLHSRHVRMSESMRAICGYVLMETTQTVEAAHLIQTGDAHALGRVMNRVQAGLRNQMEVTCPETDWLVKRAVECPGCLGAMQVSNCSAGSVLMLCNESGWEAYEPKLDEYQRIFGFHPRWSIYQSGGPLKVNYPAV